MENKHEKRQHGLRASRIAKWLLLAAIAAIILSTSMKDWPYYKASVPGGFVTESHMFMRGTWGEQVHLPLPYDAEFTARAICYPRESSGFQPCHLVINLVNPGSKKIDFSEKEFVVRDPSNHDIRFDSKTWKKEQGITSLFIVNLNYKKPPEEFELVLPGLAIDNKVQAMPVIKFVYEDTFPYQLVPWITNY